MKWLFKKYKKVIITLIIILFLIAGILDIKYEGLFFQLLPESIQAYLADIF